MGGHGADQGATQRAAARRSERRTRCTIACTRAPQPPERAGLLQPSPNSSADPPLDPGSQPADGRELTNIELENALTTKSNFTEEEWRTFGIRDLKIDDFIKSEKN